MIRDQLGYDGIVFILQPSREQILELTVREAAGAASVIRLKRVSERLKTLHME